MRASFHGIKYLDHFYDCVVFYILVGEYTELMHQISCLGAISSAFSFLLSIPFATPRVKSLIIPCLDDFQINSNDCLCPMNYPFTIS